MEIIYSKNSLKFLAKLDNKSRDRILAGIQGLILSPPQGDIKILKGYTDGRKRLRIGAYRIIFRFDVSNKIEVLCILNIGNRGDIYKD